MTSRAPLKAIVFSLLFALFAAPPASAQVSTAVPAPVQYIVSPQNPGPGQFVYVEVQGVGTFLGNSTITWSVNGKTFSSGVGQRTFSFTTGALGQTTQLDVSIQSSEYGLITHTFTFNPSYVNLTWEGETTVPPFYKGRALMSPGATARVAAFPVAYEGGRAVSPSQLSYQWKVNDQAVPEQSGLGRNSFVLSSNWLHTSETVSVDVVDGNTTLGSASMNVPATAPFIDLYPVDPLRGTLYDFALAGSIRMTAAEETLQAEPFYFSPESFSNGKLAYAWQLNGNDTTGPNAAQGELTLRQTGGAGSANVSVSLQNTDSTKLLQQASREVSLSFGGTGNLLNSLFGI